jgi:hypothetical protein
VAVAAGIYVVKDALLTVEGTDYANQVTVARLVPETPVQQLRTLVPDGTLSDVDSPIWTLELTIVQKNNTGGLAKYLRAQEAGTELDIVLTPKDKTGEDKATFVAMSMPTAFGGQQGQFPTAEIVLPVLGVPVFSAVA